MRNPRAHKGTGLLYQQVLGLIREAGDAGITNDALMLKTGLGRRSIQNHTSDLRINGLIVSCGEVYARVQMLAGTSPKAMEAAAAKAREAWHAAREPERKAKEAVRAQQMRDYCKEWRKTGPKVRAEAKPKAKAEAKAANTVAQAIKTLDRKPWEPKPKPVPPTVAWCAPERHYKEPTKPGRYEVLDAVGCFSSMKPGQYAFEPASVAARVKA